MGKFNFSYKTLSYFLFLNPCKICYSLLRLATLRDTMQYRMCMCALLCVFFACLSSTFFISFWLYAHKAQKNIYVHSTIISFMSVRTTMYRRHYMLFYKQGFSFRLVKFTNTFHLMVHSCSMCKV